MKRILLHGLGQTAASWEETVRWMEAPEEVLCLELFSLLQGRACTYENLYGAFVEYCRGIPGPVGLGGLSLGGILALQYSLEHAEKVTGVVLIGTQVVMPKGLLWFQNGVFRLLPDKAFVNMGIEKREAIQLCRSMARLDFQQDLKRLACPALVVCGERDWVNRRAAEALRKGLPRGQLVIVERAGHEVNQDAPEALGRALDAFFRR